MNKKDTQTLLSLTAMLQTGGKTSTPKIAPLLLLAWFMHRSYTKIGLI